MFKVFMIAYSNGIFSHHGQYTLYTILAILFLTIIGMTHSLYFNMVFRILAFFFDSKLGLLGQDPVFLWRRFFGSLGIAILVFGCKHKFELGAMDRSILRRDDWGKNIPSSCSRL